MDESACIMLIHHAEPAGASEQAVDRSGHPDAGSLSVAGWIRAGALVRHFAPADGRAGPPHLARPQHLVAAKPTPDRPSTRPRDTLLPLAEALELDIDESFGTDDALPAVAAQLRRRPGPVLVCWRHDGLPALANELLQRPDAPSRWPENRYDLVWVLERASLSWTLVQQPQRLLAGDSTHTIPRRRPAR